MLNRVEVALTPLGVTAGGFFVRDRLMPAFFVCGLLARGVFLAPIFHWQVVLMDYTFSNTVGANNWLSVSLVVLILGATAFGMAGALTQSVTHQRMKLGSQLVSQWRSLVLSVGALSLFGGVVLLRTENAIASWLAISLGLATLLLETLSAIGSRLSEPVTEADIPRTSESFQVPGWALGLSVAFVAVVLPVCWFLFRSD